MSCNLGAENSNPGGTSCRGLLYQWGRKDPFLPAGFASQSTTDYSYAASLLPNVYNNAGTLINISNTVGTGEVFQAVLTNSNVGTVDYAIKHPTHFIASVNPGQFGNGNESGTSLPASYINNGNWYWVADGNYDANDKLWGGLPYSKATLIHTSAGEEIFANNGATVKSIFDPCPSGWMLPASDAWLGLTSTGLKSGDWSQFNVTEDRETFITNGGYTFYMQDFKNGPTLFFSAQGIRVSDGSMMRTISGYCGGYYTTAASKGGNVYVLHIHNGLIDSYDFSTYVYARRACAASLRCVREVKD